MLKEMYYTSPTELDTLIFGKLIPADHYLRQVKTLIDFEPYRHELASCYSADEGRPADDPVLMVKLEFLQFQYDLSDREVIAEAQVNVAFRYFLDVSIESTLPHPSLLSVFRRRLGPEKHEALFQELLRQARTHGLVKDRLRLKDATHVIANIAIPSTLRLVAETRDQLLVAAESFDPHRVAQEHLRADRLRQATATLSDEERLFQRVQHLRELVDWADTLTSPSASPAQNQTLRDALQLAHKVLADREQPHPHDRVLSIHDPDARIGKHGGYFNGYLLDVALDADSELVTAVDLLPANVDEAANAQALLTREKFAQHNTVQALSIDGIGFRGDLLRQWTDPRGLNLQVFVPPTPRQVREGCFTPDDFALDASGERLICPNEATSTRRTRTHCNSGWDYHFVRSTCMECRLQKQCLPRLPRRSGRSVVKNDYEIEYAAARAKALTPAYAAARRQHSRIERKLAEMVRQHALRRARYWGRARMQIQALLTALVVNIKRMVHLISAPLQAAKSTA